MTSRAVFVIGDDGNPYMPAGPRVCLDCGCSEADHAFGEAYRAYAAQVINDGEARRDGVNVCLACQSCGRNEEGE